MSEPKLYCNRCSEPNPVGSRFCESCGDPFDSPVCNCGAELVKNARFCHMCGVAVSYSALLSEAIGEKGSTDSNIATDSTLPSPEEQGEQLCQEVLALHQQLMEVHYKADAAIREEKLYRTQYEAAHQQSQSARDSVTEIMKTKNPVATKNALQQQVAKETAAAEAKAQWELSKATCDPLREELFQLHNQFLNSVDISLGRIAEVNAWTAAEEMFRECFNNEASTSRKARILYAIGIISRDGLGDIERAKMALEQAVQLDPRQTQAKNALQTLS